VARGPRAAAHAAFRFRRSLSGTGSRPAARRRGCPDLAPLASELAAQWHGLLPGFHRLSFDDGRVLLTLCVGDVQPMLRAQRFEADSIFLDGFSPQQDPAMGSPDTLKAVSRFARQGTRVAAGTDTPAVRQALTQSGFVVENNPGLPPELDGLRGVFAPTWTVRRREPLPERIETPGRCAVIGAGLAGAAVAASLARRGWQVTVLDAADSPAAGASGLPVGMLAPHVSPDDALLSRLTRAGIRATWGELARLLEEGSDWRATGVLERRPDGDVRVPAGWSDGGPNESWPANAEQLAAVGLPSDTPALWHARAAWVRPHRLIAAWLRQPGVAFRGGCRVARMTRSPSGWQLFDPSGQLLAEADRVVVCAGFESGAFAPQCPCNPCAARSPGAGWRPTRPCPPRQSMATATWSRMCLMTKALRSGWRAPPSTATAPAWRPRLKMQGRTGRAWRGCTRARLRRWHMPKSTTGSAFAAHRATAGRWSARLAWMRLTSGHAPRWALAASASQSCAPNCWPRSGTRSPCPCRPRWPRR
jgi:hypothetical protein